MVDATGSFGSRIKQAREAAGLTQAQLGKELAHPVSRQVISMMENGKPLSERLAKDLLQRFPNVRPDKEVKISPPSKTQVGPGPVMLLQNVPIPEAIWQQLSLEACWKGQSLEIVLTEAFRSRALRGLQEVAILTTNDGEIMLKAAGQPWPPIK